MKNQRYAGVLMPISALPSNYGIGTLGKSAKNFIDFLAKSCQKIWQVLPLVPTGYGDSPYSSTCAVAGNPYFIDIDNLIENGLITEEEALSYSCNNGQTVDYFMLFKKRIPLLKLAFSRFNKKDKNFIDFVNKGEYKEFSLFMSIKECNDYKPFTLWEDDLKFHREIALKKFEKDNENSVLFWQFTQFIFFNEWNEIREYAHKNNIEIMGDMPLYVSDDSVEVWSNPQLFLMDENRKLSEVAGVPPDYFSEDGQLWGNPLYNWELMEKDNFTWWNNRLKKAFTMYDYVRIDHFRGFDRFYAIPQGATSAKVGRWCDGPKEKLFEDKKHLKIIAEDLGILDDGVYRLMKNTGYPGMKVLEFAFDGDPKHQYKPSNYSENCVAYTGTHDNDTFVEYIEKLDKNQKRKVYFDIKRECKNFDINIKRMSKNIARKAVIEIAYKSKAKFVILPISDVLGLGKEGHINHPGLLGTFNWSFKLDEKLLTKKVANNLKSLVFESHRN